RTVDPCRGHGFSSCDWPVSAADGRQGLGDVAGEALVNEAHDHCALADRRGATLDRTGANIAYREDTGHARLEDALSAGSRARDDEAVVIERERATQPVGARCGAEEEKEVRERNPLAVFE